MASVVGRPAAAIGGAAGGLARRNAMRNPGRTAVTASALMIGVALVTAVTVVAQGLEDQSRGALERRVQASTIVTAADGWSPIDPKIEQAVARVGTVSSVRQDGALVFGHQEGVNGVDPATIGGLYRYDFTAGRLTARRRDRRRGLREGAPPARRQPLHRHLDEGQRADADRDAGSRSRPVLDVLGFGPITISHAAFDGAFEQRRNRLTFVDGPQDAVAKALAPFPSAKAEGKDAFIDGQTAWIGRSSRSCGCCSRSP